MFAHCFATNHLPAMHAVTKKVFLFVSHKFYNAKKNPKTTVTARTVVILPVFLIISSFVLWFKVGPTDSDMQQLERLILVTDEKASCVFNKQKKKNSKYEILLLHKPRDELMNLQSVMCDCRRQRFRCRRCINTA